MRVYEATLSYEATLFEVGATVLAEPATVYAYMKDTLETYPMHEVFHTIEIRKERRAGPSEVANAIEHSFIAQAPRHSSTTSFLDPTLPRWPEREAAPSPVVTIK